MSIKITSIQQLFARLDTRPLRERVLLLMVFIVCVVFAADQLIFQPATRVRKSTQGELAQLTADNQSLRSAMHQAEIAAEADPNAETREQIERLKTSLAEFDQQLQQRLIHLLSPAEMPALLQQLLQQQKDLRLLKLENLPPVSVLSSAAEDAPRAELYRHALNLEIAGDYLDLLNYLKALEAMPHKFYWDLLRIDRDETTPPHIRLQLHTLSLSEDWIGV